MLRRSKNAGSDTSAEPEQTVLVKDGGKGRPTPSRREAEAARKARAKVPQTRKERSAAARKARQESTMKMREALRTGDERHLPARDKGPVRRFVRDFVDARFSFIELVIPLMVLTLVLGYLPSASLRASSQILMLGIIVLVGTDLVGLRFRLRRELARRFPDESHKGAFYYAFSRAMQMRFMRLPKTGVKIGTQLPDTYR